MKKKKEKKKNGQDLLTNSTEQKSVYTAVVLGINRDQRSQTTLPERLLSCPTRLH